MMKEGGADMGKVLASPDVIREVVKKGVPVFAEMHSEKLSPEELVAKAKQLEAAGATMIDFRHSGPVAGAAVAKAVSIPVIGGLGGGPWLDGRVRMINAAIGYSLDMKSESYANVGQTVLAALKEYAENVRSGKKNKGPRDTRYHRRVQLPLRGDPLVTPS